MIVLVALMLGLAFWIAYWGLGLKAFDGFMVTIALVVGAAAWQLAAPWVKRQFGRPGGTSGEV